MVQRVLSEDEEEAGQSSPRSGPLGDRSNKVSAALATLTLGGLLCFKRARIDREGRAVKRDSGVNDHRRGSRSQRRAGDSGDDAYSAGEVEDVVDAAEEETVRPKFETQPRDKDG
jgi:hypothetical protein